MSRKHFEALAKSISQIADMNQRAAAATAVAITCIELNPRFNFDKFYKACGVI